MKITNRQEYLEAQSSEKLILVHLEAGQKMVNFDYNGVLYSKFVKHFVVGVLKDGVAINFNYNPLGNQVSFYATDSKNIVFIYRFFFSNIEINLPWNLEEGFVVPYLPLVSSVNGGSMKLDLKTGISLEGNASINLNNDRDVFDGIYDKLIFSNRDCTIYDYHRDIPLSDKGIIFAGRIVGNSYSVQNVSFSLKNLLYDLRSDYYLPLIEGEKIVGRRQIKYKANLVGKPLREVRGFNTKMKLIASDIVADGYLATKSWGSEKDYVNPLRFDGAFYSDTIYADHADVYNDIFAGDSITIKDNSFKVFSLYRRKFKNITKAYFTMAEGTGFYVFEMDKDEDGLWQESNSIIGDFIAFDYVKNFEFAEFLKGVYQITGTDVGDFYGDKTQFKVTFDLSHLWNEETEQYMIPEGDYEIDCEDDNVFIVKGGTSLGVVLEKRLETAFVRSTAKVKPSVPNRRMNRYFTVASHKLASPTFEILEIASDTLVRFDRVDSLKKGDLLQIGSSRTLVLKRSGNWIHLSGIIPGLTVGEIFTKLPVQKINFKGNTLNVGLDYTVSNEDNKSEIRISAKAEKRFASQYQMTVTTKQGSPILYSTRSFANVKNGDIFEIQATEYQVQEKVSDSYIIVDKNFTVSRSYSAVHFSIDAIKDDDILTADVLGKPDSEGREINNASMVTLDVIKNTSISKSINLDSFIYAKEAFNHDVAIQIPEKIGDKAPTYQTVIKDLCLAVNAVVYNDKDYVVNYKQLVADIDSYTVIEDLDIISISVTTDSAEVISNLKYVYGKEDADTKTASENLSKVLELENEVYLYDTLKKLDTVESLVTNENSAKAIASRELLQRSKQENTFELSMKLKFSDLNIFDIIVLKSSKVFEMIGNTEKEVICIITSINKSGKDIRLTCTDLASFYQKTARITPNDAPEYTDSTSEQIAIHGHITNPDGYIVDENDLDTNKIS